MAEMPQMVAFTILITILYIGDFVSIRTRAWIPSVFVCAVLFLAGYWTFFPKDIVARAGITPAVVFLLMYFLIVNMGTLLSIKELSRQWKTVVISLTSIVGIIAVSFLVGRMLFDWNTIIVAIPPLVGGVVSSIIMSTKAAEYGLDTLAIFAVVIYVMQGFVGYPLTSIVLKKEGEAVLDLYRQGKWQIEEEDTTILKDKVMTNEMPSMFKQFPAEFNTTYFCFLRIGIVALIAYLAAELVKPLFAISPFVLCLLFGVIAASVGFLERHPLQVGNGFGFAVMGLMLYIFDALSRATPAMLWSILFPLVVLIACAVIGMYIFSIIAGKILGVSKHMAFAIALTALYGFPADYIITNEVINMLTQDPKEREVLTKHMMASMLIGGFISVTMVSVVLAGIMVGMIVNPNAVM